MSPRILVVDDKLYMLRLASYTLETKGGYETITATDGGQALAILEAETAPSKPGIDLVLCDIAMPEVDGLELLRTIRATPHLADLPVIMFTARGEEADKDIAVEAGCNGYLLKPFSSHELLSEVARHLVKKRASTQQRKSFVS